MTVKIRMLTYSIDLLYLKFYETARLMDVKEGIKVIFKNPST